MVVGSSPTLGAMENNNQLNTWVKAAEHHSFKATLSSLEAKNWRRIADELAFALDLISDDPSNIKSWFKVKAALDRYESASKEV